MDFSLNVRFSQLVHPLGRRMQGSNPGLLRHRHGLPDALTTRLDLIHTRLGLIHSQLDLIHTRLDLIHTRLDLIHTRLDLIHPRLDLIHTRLDLVHSRLDLIHTRLDLIHAKQNYCGASAGCWSWPLGPPGVQEQVPGDVGGIPRDGNSQEID